MKVDKQNMKNKESIMKTIMVVGLTESSEMCAKGYGELTIEEFNYLRKY